MIQLIEIQSAERCSLETRLLLREFSHRINNEFAFGHTAAARSNFSKFAERRSGPLDDFNQK
jgi:hypothetical protein